MPGMHKIFSESHFKEFVYGFQLSEVSPHAFLPPMHLVEKSIEGLAGFAWGHSPVAYQYGTGTDLVALLLQSGLHPRSTSLHG